MVNTPKLPLIKLMGSVMLLSLPLLSTPVAAEEFLCDATQASTNDLPTLDIACPIGKGLWGNMGPRAQQSQFWIQCGLFGQPLSLNKGKQLYKHISTDVWMKPEPKGYRCLIGPYSDFSQAKQDLAKVRTEPSYKEAFIREVEKGAPRVTPVAAVKAAPKPKQPAKAVAVSASQQKKTVIPAPVRQSSEPIVRNASELNQVQSMPQTKPEEQIDVRRETTISGVEYKVPYMMFGNEQFYMEHELPWNRMDYEQAYKTCYRLGMHLANAKEWQTLLDSDVMLKDKWPVHLPYWGTEKVGLFTSGKVNQLKGTSLLNVMCVK